LAAKAPLASPALTGTPTAPTAAVGTNTTQVATTAFVNAEIANDAPSKTGTGASGTWGIDITGNANTVDGYHVQVDGTGTDPNTIYFKTTGGGIGVDWDDISNTPTTVAGYGITDVFTETESDARFLGISATAVNSDKVDGYNVQVDGTGTDPNTIYFKTTGGTISVDWDDVSNTPTTVAGYGITDAVTTSGNQTIGGTKTFSSTISGSIDGNSNTVDGYHVQVDGTGTDPNTIYFKTTGGTTSVEWGNISGTLSSQTDLQSALDGKVALAGTQTITGNKTFTGSVTMGQSGGGEGGEILWLDPVQGTVCTDIPASGFFRVFQTSGTFKGAYIDLANCAGGVGSLLLHSTNYNSYAPTLTGGGASGSWGISVTGNAGTVTNGVYTTGNQTIGGVKTFSNDIGSTFGGQLVLTNSASGATNPNKHFRVGPTGNLEIINSAYNSVPFTFTDAGILSVSAECNAPVFKDVNNSAYYLDPANTGTSMVVAGNIGIGTTSPTTKLQIGDIGATDATFQGRIKLEDTSASLQSVGGLEYATSTFGAGYGWKINSIDSSGVHLVFGTRQNSADWTETMRITGAGNVGIGTTSPGRRLSIAGGGFAFDDANTSTRSIHWGNGTNYPLLIQGDATNGFISFNTHASGSGPPERLRIDSAGKVLIGAGATASLGKLVVSEASSGTAVIALESQGSWNSTIACTSTGNLVLRNNGASDRMVFDPYGNIITYGPMFASIYYDNDNSAFYLDPNNTGTSLNVAGAIQLPNSKSLAFRNVANTASAFFIMQSDDNFVAYNAANAPIFSFGQGASPSAVYGANASNRMIVNGSSNIISFNVDGTEKLTINGSGNLVATGNVTAYSDIRVKDNVESIEGAIGKLNQIRGVTYTRTDLDDKQRKYAGVIAQEIEQVLPEAVFDNGKVKSVDYNATIALLIEAVKEQQVQINELKLTIEQLKGN
jgi:hypothetical protein